MSDEKKVSTTELERQIFEKEEIKVVIRAARGEMFPSYPYQRKMSQNSTVTEWTDSRIKPLLGDTEFEIVRGDGNSPHGRSKMETVRNSYKD